MRTRSSPREVVRAILLLAIPALLGTVGFVQGLAAQQNPPQAQPQPQNRPAQQNNQDVTVVPLQGTVSLIVGAGGNILVQIPPPGGGRGRVPAGDESRGEFGVLLVDTGLAPMGEKVRAVVQGLSNAPVRYILNTHVHPDHVGNNALLAKPAAGRGGRGGAPGLILAHETVLARMSEGEDGKPPTAEQPAWPTDTYLDQKDMWFNNESIQVFHVPNAHTDGDSLVYFRRSDVVAAGDIYVTTSFPIIDAQRGGHVNGIIDGLNRIIDLTIASNNEEGGTVVIPGHGRISDEADVAEYRNMTVVIRDRIQDLIKKGMSLEQVKAAKPTLDYDYRYGGTPTSFWNTEKFVTAVYNDLAKSAPKPAAAPGRAPGRTGTK